MSGKKYVSYSDSGVDIQKGDEFVDIIAKKVKGIGGFSGGFEIPKKYKKPVLFSSTDGVGTKLLVANAMKKHDTVGIDLVAMVVNDLIVCGAEPLVFLDYFATGKLMLKQAEEILTGILEGCKQANCKLSGGETAELPGLYANEDYDLAGFGVGVGDKEKLITGKDIKIGDVVLGLASTGVHSNGFSLARRVLVDKGNYPLKKKHPELGASIGDTLLTPTKIYVKSFLALQKKFEIKGAAHITGSGIPGNLPRAFPKGLTAEIELGSWPILPIFNLIEKTGPVTKEEMFNTFNMGLGMMLIVSPKDADKIAKAADKLGEKCYKVGTVIKGNEVVFTE